MIDLMDHFDGMEDLLTYFDLTEYDAVSVLYEQGLLDYELIDVLVEPPTCLNNLDYNFNEDLPSDV